MRRTLPLFASTLVLAAACATPSFLRSTPASAEEQYAQAMEDLESSLYPEAINGFAELKTKYPYTKYAALADLRTADTNLKRAAYQEAIDGYRNFTKYHPNHEEGAYALKQVGEAYYQQIPEDWFFLPPAAEKDQNFTRLAISAYRDMLSRYPEHEHAKGARARLDECRRKLADHEMYVARFYFDRDAWPAAAVRAEGLLADYGGLGLDAEALWIAARSRGREGNVERARIALERLIKEFPEEANAAQDELRELGPSATPPPATDSATPPPGKTPNPNERPQAGEEAPIPKTAGPDNG